MTLANQESDSVENGATRREYQRHQERRGLLPTSIEKREILLRSFSKWLGGRSYWTVQREDVELYLDSRDLGNRSRYTALSHFHCFYQWAIDEELCAFDPTARIQRPKLRRAVPRPARSDELADAIKWAGARERCWIVLAAYQGLRCQEIAGLCREDVLEADGLLRVVYGKGGHERLIPLHSEVLAALEELPMPSRGWLFTRPHGGKFTPGRLSQKLNEALADLGVGATAHQLRHWFGSNLYAETHDLRVVQEMMGHASPTTTAIYTAFDKEKARSGIAALDVGNVARSVALAGGVAAAWAVALWQVLS